MVEVAAAVLADELEPATEGPAWLTLISTPRIDTIEDSGVDGGEYLITLHPPKELHRPASSSQRQVRILDPVAEKLAFDLYLFGTHRLQGSAVRSQQIGGDGLRPTETSR
ncbi:hypothetical protein R3X27_22195 [Tropicimonas sp. TH_r6]|nr:hypothetical protein [Tropicimonas sp. TH_r6]MDV7145406.1 hypothetical protein [Tropicimonas sp. TH_r6]